MAHHNVTICCWHKGHLNEFAMTRRQEEGLLKKLKQLKAVCPTCKEAAEGNQSIFILKGETPFGSHKTYQCRHGHTTCVGAFSNGMLSVKYGNGYDDHFNIEGKIEELEELIDKKEISCHHVKENGRLCDCKLKAIDDAILSYPSVNGIKTKTRVGDIWDKAKIEPVRQGTYDNQGHYRGTHTEKANIERLNQIRKKRNTEAAGKILKKPTKKKYGKRSKSSVKPEKLS